MKNIKISFIITTATMLTASWLYLFVTDTQDTNSNAFWQVCLALISIAYAVLGLLSATRWGWNRRGIGRGITFISLGMLSWGLGQAGWAYLAITQPEIEAPKAPIMEILYLACIPLWSYGILQLAKVTGAKYGLRSYRGKLFALFVFLSIAAISYYFLLVVARGGAAEYFSAENLPEDSYPLWWIAISDLGYAFGDAILLGLSVAVFGLSWKYLGGKFRKPIIGILVGFGGMYMADFFFSYYDGKGEYYNGHWTDLAFLAVMAILGSSLVLLYPPKKTMPNKTEIVGAVPSSTPQVIQPTQITGEPS